MSGFLFEAVRTPFEPVDEAEARRATEAALDICRRHGLRVSSANDATMSCTSESRLATDSVSSSKSSSSGFMFGPIALKTFSRDGSTPAIWQTIRPLLHSAWDIIVTTARRKNWSVKGIFRRLRGKPAGSRESGEAGNPMLTLRAAMLAEIARQDAAEKDKGERSPS